MRAICLSPVYKPVQVVPGGGFPAKTGQGSGEVDAELAQGIEGSLQDFVRALRRGTAPMGECHDNLKSLAMMFAAIESVRTGQRVKIRVR